MFLKQFHKHLGRDVKLVTEDVNGVVALLKPSGILSHPNKINYHRSLLMLPYLHKEEAYAVKSTGFESEDRIISLLHRLDSFTSGPVLLSTSIKASESIKALFAERRVNKIYNAVIFGDYSDPNDQWHDKIEINRDGNKLRVKDDGPLHAHTVVRVIGKIKDFPRQTLIELKPSTGRTHQLRFQCAKRNIPIVGDNTYGDFALNKLVKKDWGNNRLCLHLSHISFRYSLDGQHYDFSCDCPHPFH